MKKIELFGSGDAQKYLGVSQPRFHELVKKYEIPFFQTSSGRIFLKKDIEAFQKRREKLGVLKRNKK